MISYVFSKNSIVYKRQPRVETKVLLKSNGLEFNEQHHRWMSPDTGEPIGIRDIPENDSEMGNRFTF